MSDPKIEELRAKYGRVVVAEVEGKTLVFKPLNRAKLADLRKQMTKSPDLQLELVINACEFCCVLGSEHFKELADRYPLAFAGDATADGVINVLLHMARGAAVITSE